MTVNVTQPSIEVSALPGWTSVLAVVADPDDESFGLGAVLDAFARSGCTVSVLCLTKGEASTVHGVSGDLRTLRAMELQNAAAALGADSAVLSDHPDGALDRVDPVALVREVSETATRVAANGFLVFDPSGVTGHPDHVAASSVALDAAKMLDLPVLGWTLPQAVAEQLNDEFGTRFIGHELTDIDLTVPVNRVRQRAASLAHASQAVPTSVLWRRLDLLGDVEHLRRLLDIDCTDSRSAVVSPAGAADDSDVATMRVEYRSDDRFDFSIRDHVVTVDQPTEGGGYDTAPTPTELFVAGLASCVAIYARRYLRRHRLDASGLTVETSYRMGTTPTRVSQVDLKIIVPQELPPVRRDGLLKVASHCTVHNSITTAPDITVRL